MTCLLPKRNVNTIGRKGVGRTIISQPGTTGGMDWGGVSIDRDHDIMIVNSMRMPMIATGIGPI